MTEVEKADQIAGDTRRRFWQNFALMLALVLGLAGVILGWHGLDQRAESAETSAVSLAQQVQDACATQGSLDLQGRDLCQQADDVVQGSPPAGPAGAQGVQGERGFTGAQGIQGRTGPPGEVGPDGPIGPRGEQGAQGVAGMDGERGMPGADGNDGVPGPMGPPGPAGTNGKDGPRGVGIAKVECPASGDWIITLTDGTAQTVTGPCRVPPTTPPVTTTKK